MELCTVSKAYLDCENIYLFPTLVFNTWWRVNLANEADICKWTRECTKFKQIYYLTFKGKNWGKNWAKNQVRDKCDKKDDGNDKIEWQKEKRPSIHTNTCIHIIYTVLWLTTVGSLSLPWTENGTWKLRKWNGSKCWIEEKSLSISPPLHK